ncbi:thioredoxin family protein [Planktothrix sp. FACHB-1355]|uniref:Thioredoxin family protein n=1 Tax=Aerosakkonema funiforme FACHB-1375 TaxID=2949571 RepID=A0A926ZGS5_9CYAN|nr:MULTISPECIES: thioredoxin family protein [Oscillatoriales]MBD2180126.1 thioredoxin family protein [Aerosakkonema funiforme FACHB-1375]MBD3559299.1 thioredoxin family protein [Planktothrix sp. FACHB-1355]
MLLSVNERTFSQEVLKSPTPVLVHFAAPWCGLCKLITPQLSRFQAKLGEKVKVVYVNADENFKISHSYRLTTLPTLILFVDGEIAYRFDCFRNRDDLSAVLELISLGCAEHSKQQRLQPIEYQHFSA